MEAMLDWVTLRLLWALAFDSLGRHASWVLVLIWLLRGFSRLVFVSLGFALPVMSSAGFASSGLWSLYSPVSGFGFPCFG